PPPVATPAPEAPPPPPPAGQPTGTLQGLGSLSLNVSDFPYTWYIQAVHRKIHERWEGRAIQGRQPEVIFEIARDGKLKGVSISKSSGNPAYDQFALRAVASASPFPPLPQGFEKSVLTIGLQFIYDSSTR
ncbi:MAG TPA: energy transducer TonB, partial [Methylomirabilota bacterium]|nr:energy transducer TonB [Methylomirabilota bacterium]